MKKLPLILLSIAVALSATTAQAASIYYVAANGNDQNFGTQASPFRTISHALAASNIGDKIIVFSGNYAPFTFSDRTIECIPARTCIASDTIRLQYRATLKGFVVDGARVHASVELGIQGNIQSGNNLAENNEVRNGIQCPEGRVSGDGVCPTYADVDGFRFFGSNNIMRGNYIHDVTYLDSRNQNPDPKYTPHIDCFQTYFGADNNIIENNVCDNFSSHPNQGTQGVMLQDATNTIIRNNYFHTYHAKVNIRESSNVTITNNIFIGGPIGLQGQQYGVYNGNGTNVTVRNNVFWDINGGTTPLISNVPAANQSSNVPANASGSRSSLVYVDPNMNGFCSVKFPLVGISCGMENPTNTPTPTKTATRTPTPTSTNTVTVTPTLTPIPPIIVPTSTPTLPPFAILTPENSCVIVVWPERLHIRPSPSLFNSGTMGYYNTGEVVTIIGILEVTENITVREWVDGHNEVRVEEWTVDWAVTNYGQYFAMEIAKPRLTIDYAKPAPCKDAP